MLLVLQNSPCKAVQDYFEDTVWTKKTDQPSGFYQVKISNTDSMIVAHGYAIAYVYKTLSGEQIARLPFNAEVHFFNNDLNFIQLAPSRDMLIVFETKEFKAIDTLEFDGEAIGDVEISKDEKYLVAVVASGYRIWSLENGKILRTKKYVKEENQTNFQIEQICFNNDNTVIIATEYREFVEPEYPHNQYFTLRHNIYDFNTFDSLGTFIDKAYYRLSNTNKYIAFKRLDPDYGVEIYNYLTKELVQKLFINGLTLTGIEFSPDDKYIVTTNDFGLMRIWDIETAKGVYDYTDGGYSNLDITSDGKFIITSIGRYLLFYPAKYGGSTVPGKTEIIKTIYPNPTNGIVNIELDCPNSKIQYDIYVANAVLIKSSVIENNISLLQIDLSNYANAVYYIRINCGNNVLTYKIIKAD